MKKTRQLISSLVAIVICFAMLIGTTYAWFTDSVINTNNIIKSGNIDVELYHNSNDKDSFEKVEGDTKLFVNTEGDPILWEPGASAKETFEVRNVGTLALQYRFSIRVLAKDVNANGQSLLDVLTLTVNDAKEDFDTEFEGLALVGSAVEADDVYTAEINWVPTENDNDFRNLELKLGIELVATQYAYEEDGAGSDYDAGASIDSAVLVQGGVLALEGDVTEETTIAEGAKVVINMNDNTISNTLTNNGEVAVNGGTIESENVGLSNNGKATLTDVVVKAGSSLDYSNITSGNEAQTTYDNVEINSAGGGVGVQNGAKVTFNSGSVEVNTTSTSGRYLFYVEGEGSELTINGGEFADFTKTSQNQKRAYIYAGAGTTVYVTGGTFGKASTRSDYPGIKGTGTVIITGGTFGFDPSTWVAEGYQAVQEGDVWVVKANA